MKSPAVPRLYLGTMTFGWSQTSSTVDSTVALEMLQQFSKHHEKYITSDSNTDVPRIDTARIYAGGKTETILGQILPKCSYKVSLGSKAHPSQVGGLSPKGIQDQFEASLKATNVDKFDEYYLHQPDPDHSLKDSLECLNSLVNKNLVGCIGMSNYHASEVDRAFQICEENSWTKPVVYQGLYNPLNRAVEKDLLPILKANNCSFVAYNPLAAGLLAGKHVDLNQVQKGRFKDNQNYLPRFYTRENFEAIQLIREACEKEGLSMVEATFCWLLRHSALTSNDGLLLGASSLTQLQQNLQACTAAIEKGPLSENMLRVMDEAWQITQATAFPYWRSYSSDMPNRDSLDHGASYDAAKK